MKMTSQRFALMLYTAALTSSWWGAARWGYGETGPLWIAPIVLTLVALVVVGMGLSEEIDK